MNLSKIIYDNENKLIQERIGKDKLEFAKTNSHKNIFYSQFAYNTENKQKFDDIFYKEVVKGNFKKQVKSLSQKDLQYIEKSRKKVEQIVNNFGNMKDKANISKKTSAKSLAFQLIGHKKFSDLKLGCLEKNELEDLKIRLEQNKIKKQRKASSKMNKCNSLISFDNILKNRVQNLYQKYVNQPIKKQASNLQQNQYVIQLEQSNSSLGNATNFLNSTNIQELEEQANINSQYLNSKTYRVVTNVVSDNKRFIDQLPFLQENQQGFLNLQSYQQSPVSSSRLDLFQDDLNQCKQKKSKKYKINKEGKKIFSPYKINSQEQQHQQKQSQEINFQIQPFKKNFKPQIESKLDLAEIQKG